MIKVIALATASVQTTPTGWVCLLSDLTANVCHLLDVAWCFCSSLTFLHVKFWRLFFFFFPMYLTASEDISVQCHALSHTGPFCLYCIWRNSRDFPIVWWRMMKGRDATPVEKQVGGRKGRTKDKRVDFAAPWWGEKKHISFKARRTVLIWTCDYCINLFPLILHSPPGFVTQEAVCGCGALNRNKTKKKIAMNSQMAL